MNSCSHKFTMRLWNGVHTNQINISQWKTARLNPLLWPCYGRYLYLDKAFSWDIPSGTRQEMEWRPTSSITMGGVQAGKSSRTQQPTLVSPSTLSSKSHRVILMPKLKACGRHSSIYSQLTSTNSWTYILSSMWAWNKIIWSYCSLSRLEVLNRRYSKSCVKERDRTTPMRWLNSWTLIPAKTSTLMY